MGLLVRRLKVVNEPQCECLEAYPDTAIVVMCTNRLEAIDPAVRRRAAVTFTFSQPNEAQRLAFLKPVLEERGFNGQQIHTLVTATEATHERTYGYTYSDLAQRLGL